MAHLVDRYAEELVEPEETADDDEEPEGIRRWERLSERGRSEGEPPLERRWTDVVMIDRPFRFDQDVLAEANWVIAFSVYTAELWQEDEAEAAAAGAPRARRRDRVPALQRLVPNFDFARYRPRYCYDVDGIAEIVLETPQIGRAEVVYATKLFALANRVREVWLDGEPVKTLLVRPGAGERRRRRSR
ncbi:MAG: hypothetical protein KatS3mg102_0603 [Planctomycetota bacterium]|nr:MAG: hypothetical protein KatS3mg102_0603 [Planctomycetota bacterium]